MPRTPEQYEEIRSEKRRKIMDVALELFANDGYHTTSISQIAERANISKGLMYNYFESKEELLKSIVGSFSDEMSERMNPDHDEKITREEANLFFDWYFNMLDKKKEQMKLFLQLSVQPQVLEHVTNGQVFDFEKKQKELLMAFFSKNQQHDPEVCLIHLTAILKGFALQYVFTPESYSVQQISKYKEYLIDLFINNK